MESFGSLGQARYSNWAMANVFYPIADAEDDKGGWNIFSGCRQRGIKIFNSHLRKNL